MFNIVLKGKSTKNVGTCRYIFRLYLLMHSCVHHFGASKGGAHFNDFIHCSVACEFPPGDQ